MQAGARTIEIFLPNGEPRGTKVAHIRNRNIEATYIPRARLNDAKTRPFLKGVGIYLLIGESDQHSKPVVYIGEAEVVYSRLQQHNASKDFWNYAIALTSNNKHLTKTHVKFLEWLCHSKAANANRCALENGNIPTKPHVQESTEADLYDNFESIDLLVSTLGLNIFQPLAINRQQLTPNPQATFDPLTIPSKLDVPEDLLVFKLTGRGAEAVGKYTPEGFVVFAGAILAKELSESLAKNSPKIRDNLIKNNMLKEENGKLILKETFLFTSPSLAASIIVGNSLNGWITWK